MPFQGRVAIVAAHPDDEVVGLGSRLPLIRENACIIHITDGSPADPGDARAAGCSTREQYALLRRDELACALGQAGLGNEQCFEIGAVDQDSSRHLEAITRRLAQLLETITPAIVVTHPYEGGHPDHDAAAFAVAGAWNLIRASGRNPPAVAEFTSYHAAVEGMEVFEFLPGPEPVTTVTLSETDRLLKSKMIECFRSQERVLQYFPVRIERFRPAPQYDFMRPPHPGKLYYENFAWGLTGDSWRELARSAMDSLGVFAWR